MAPEVFLMLGRDSLTWFGGFSLQPDLSSGVRTGCKEGPAHRLVVVGTPHPNFATVFGKQISNPEPAIGARRLLKTPSECFVIRNCRQ